MFFKFSYNFFEGESLEGVELRKFIKMKLKVKDFKELLFDWV